MLISNQQNRKALVELSTVISALFLFASLSAYITLTRQIHDFITYFYGPYVLEFLINATFLLMLVLLWLMYRRWQVARVKIFELENVISSISPDLLLIVNDQGEVISCNQAAPNMLGCNAEEMLQQNSRSFFKENSTRQEIENSLKNKGHHIGTAEVQKRNGQMVDLEIVTAKLKHSSDRVLLIRDITQRKKLENQLLQSQKMEAFGKLAGGIAHDFNNILTIINGYSELVLAKLATENVLRKDLKEVLNAGKRAVALVAQLLAFSRQQVTQKKVIDINDLILDFIKVHRRIIPENIEFVTLPEAPLATVNIDPYQMQQVLTNLLVNATHAMPEGGKIIIQTKILNVALGDRHVPSELVLPGKYVVLTVTDTGTGMSGEIKEHIFEPFFTTKKEGEGTGLGLATVHAIVQQNHGVISVRSQVGKGTSFDIYLPSVNAQAAIWYEAEKSGVLPRGKETILIIEDEDRLRDFEARVLCEQGYQVLQASNGAEAMRVLVEQASRSIDLVLTDVIMPQMSGKEVAGKIRAIYPDMKIIFASGYTYDLKFQSDEMESGMTFLKKPFSPRALAHKVRAALDFKACA